MYTFGAEIVPYHDFPFEDGLRELANLGFTHVNLWSSRAPLAHHVNPGDDAGEIKGPARKYSITPTGLTMYGKTQDEMRQRIEFAADLGIDTVVFDCEARLWRFRRLDSCQALLPTCERRWVSGSRSRTTSPCPSQRTWTRAAMRSERWSEGVDTFGQIKRLHRPTSTRRRSACAWHPPTCG